jgi:hypothetical protein
VPNGLGSLRPATFWPPPLTAWRTLVPYFHFVLLGAHIEKVGSKQSRVRSNRHQRRIRRDDLQPALYSPSTPGQQKAGVPPDPTAILSGDREASGTVQARLIQVLSPAMMHKTKAKPGPDAVLDPQSLVMLVAAQWGLIISVVSVVGSVVMIR